MNGKNCLIRETKQFNKKWLSLKLNAAGLRHEFGVLSDTGDIIWVYGPYPSRYNLVLTIFREGMKNTGE